VSRGRRSSAFLLSGHGGDVVMRMVPGGQRFVVMTARRPRSTGTPSRGATSRRASRRTDARRRARRGAVLGEGGTWAEASPSARPSSPGGHGHHDQTAPWASSPRGSSTPWTPSSGGRRAVGDRTLTIAAEPCANRVAGQRPSRTGRRRGARRGDDPARRPPSSPGRAPIVSRASACRPPLLAEAPRCGSTGPAGRSPEVMERARGELVAELRRHPSGSRSAQCRTLAPHGRRPDPAAGGAP